MNGGNAIRAVRADDREIRHTHLALRAFLENAHSLDALAVTREARLHIPAHTAVDLLDDFQMARQHSLKPEHRPSFQRLRQQRMIGVSERPPR